MRIVCAHIIPTYRFGGKDKFDEFSEYWIPADSMPE
jgi:hypothetical protein